MDKPKKKISWLNLLSIVLIVLLTGEVVLLLKRNRELAIQLEAFDRGAIEPLKEGDVAPPIRVLTLDGDTVTIEYTDPGKKHFLFVLSTGCPHCMANLPRWNLIAEASQARGIDAFGISLDSLDRTQEYVEQRNVGFYSVSALVDTGFRSAYKIAGMPVTILIDADGSVEKVWMGELNDKTVEEIMQLMGAQLSAR